MLLIKSILGKIRPSKQKRGSWSLNEKQMFSSHLPYWKQSYFNFQLNLAYSPLFKKGDHSSDLDQNWFPPIFRPNESFSDVSFFILELRIKIFIIKSFLVDQIFEKGVLLKAEMKNRRRFFGQTTFLYQISSEIYIQAYFNPSNWSVTSVFQPQRWRFIIKSF